MIRFILALCAFAALSYLCDTQTKGFRFHHLLSDLPNDPKWEFPPLSQTELATLNEKLSQPFHFLGKGGWCYAFLGEDQETVLKFYRHTHLDLPSLFNSFSFQKLLLKSDRIEPESPYFQEFNFNSCKLLFTLFKERTGLLYAHLNKTTSLHPIATLIDPIGVRHKIDLNATEFLVQKKAELLIPHFSRLIENQNREEAKRSLDDLLDLLTSFYALGVVDLDKGLRNNFGFLDNRAIAIDISSFVKKPQKECNLKEELINKTGAATPFFEKERPPPIGTL